MLFPSSYLTLMLCISTLSSALPLEVAPKPRALVPRTKSYSIVNVDGGSTSAPSEPTTTIEETIETKTVDTTTIESTVIDMVTAVTSTVVHPTSEPAPTLASSSTSTPKATTSTPHIAVSTQESTPTPLPISFSDRPSETAKPIIVTVIVTATAGPPESYGNGTWHTSAIVQSSVTFASATPSF